MVQSFQSRGAKRPSIIYGISVKSYLSCKGLVTKLEISAIFIEILVLCNELQTEVTTVKLHK